MKKYRTFLKCNRSRLRIGFLGVFASTMLLSSCLENEELDLTNGIDGETFELPVNLAVPIAKGEVLLTDVIDGLDIEDFDLKTYGENDPDPGLIYFDYTNLINVGQIIDVEVPDQIESDKVVGSDFSIPDGFPVVIPAGFSYEISREVKFDMSVEGGDIDKAILESGFLNVFANNVFEGNNNIAQSLDVTILELTDDGRVFEESLGSENFDVMNSFDVSNNTLVVTTDSEDNKFIRLSYTYRIANTGTTPVMAPLTDSIYFEFSMKDVKPRYVKGYFGERELFAGNSIVDMEVIDTEYFKDSTIFFADPSVEITLINPIGMPLEVNIMQLRLINTDERDTLDLEFDVSSFTVKGGVPTFGVSQVEIDPFDTTYVFDKDNSNIDEVFGRVFDEVGLHYNVMSNPDGKDPDPNVFNVIRFDSAEIYIESHAILPLWIKAQNVVWEDTTDFDFQAEVLDSEDTTFIDNLDSITVIIDLVNSVPIEIKAHIYMVDLNYNILDSIMVNGENIILPGSDVDDEGTFIAAKTNHIELTVSKDKRDKWRNTKYIVFKAEAETSEKKFVKVYENIGIEFSVGFVASGKVNNELIDSEDTNEN